MRRRMLLWAAAMATAAVAAAAAPANAAPAGTTPPNAKAVSVATGSSAPVNISRQQYLADAKAAGMTASQLATIQKNIATSSGCWYWSTYVYYKNLIGKKILQYNLQPHWCSRGRWITDAFTDRWGQTLWPGWSYNGYDNYSRYGKGWNVYLAGGHGHFCLASYFGCVQNKYSWIEDYVGAGGRTFYFHWSG